MDHSFTSLIFAQEQDRRIQYLSDPKFTDWPKEKIFSENNLLLTSGEQRVARLNRQAVNFIQRGSYHQARKILEDIKEHAPQFLPARFNLGMTYYLLRDYEKSVSEFSYSYTLMKEWSTIPLHLGYVWERLAKYNKALDYYREAVKINNRDLQAYIALGNLFFLQKSFYRAEKYYRYALKIEPAYTDARFGIAKVLYAHQKYYDAVLLFRRIDLKKFPNYDKALHYYFAESLYKSRAYSEAVQQYELLLRFPESPFFSTYAYELIKFKLELAKKFADIQKTN